MKLLIILTLLLTCSISDSSAQKRQAQIKKFPAVLAFDSSGNYVGTKHWTGFTTTKTLLVIFSNGDTLKIGLEKLNVIGYFAVQNDGKQTKFKVGRWQSVVPGSPKLRISEGDYSLGTFEKCCEAGQCIGYYSYKSGYWKFYYSTGQVMATGTFETVPVEINTGCSNQIIRRSKLSTDWKFYNSKGDQIASDLELVNGLESFEILQ